MTRGLRAAVCFAVFTGAAAGACSSAEPSLRAAPTRGYIVISLDTLRADHLGLYGYERATSPFLDRLAQRATVFDRAIVQLPGTLPSHMSIFTGLYPAEHGVYPPDAVLAPEIVTLPMRFHRAGYRTAGFTEGGYVAGRYGFDRGFEVFSDESDLGRRAFEGTLARATDFLSSLAPSDRFFLFIHTYSVHDPYDPPEPYRSMFWAADPPDVFAPTGPNLVDVNLGRRELSEEGLRYFEALYDGGIRYADDRLAEFWQAVSDMGLQDEVTLVVTADHGEEFREHGGLVHEQVYMETLHVPLLVVHPETGAGLRVASLVESVDIAPTLYELAGFDEQPATSGTSLARYLFGEPEPEESDAYAEAFLTPTKTLLWQRDGTYQLVLERLREEAGGRWTTGSISFDWSRPELDLELRSFHRVRQVTVSANGEEIGVYEIGTDAAPLRVALPTEGSSVISLSAPDCDSPASLGLSGDERCLSFFVGGGDLARTALYDLDRDPAASVDVADRQPQLYSRLLGALTDRSFRAVAAPGTQVLDEEQLRRLRALGYIR